MAQGTSRAERERLLAEGFCMGKHCRQHVAPGAAVQFQEEDGSITRLCNKCSCKRMADPEPPEEIVQPIS